MGLIRNVGYTEDGFIFIDAIVNQGNGKPPGNVIIQMTKPRAKDLVGWIQKAIDNVPAQKGIMLDERNSPNPNKGKPPGD